ncbi:hypothetical protein [Natronospira sp.]
MRMRIAFCLLVPVGLAACAGAPVYLPPTEEPPAVALDHFPWQGESLVNGGGMLADELDAVLVTEEPDRLRLRWRTQDPEHIVSWIDCGELHNAHHLDMRIDQGSDGPYALFFTQGEGGYLDIILTLERGDEDSVPLALAYHLTNPWFQGWRFSIDSEAMAKVPNRIEGSGRMRRCRSTGLLEKQLAEKLSAFDGPLSMTALSAVLDEAGFGALGRDGSGRTMTLADVDRMWVFTTSSCGDREVGLYLYPDGNFEMTLDQWTSDDRLTTLEEWTGRWREAGEDPAIMTVTPDGGESFQYEITEANGIWSGMALEPISVPEKLQCTLSERQGVR